MGFRLLCAYLIFASTPAVAETKTRTRLVELFAWKVSDVLNLTPAEETQFTALYRDLSTRRLKAGEDLDKLVREIEKNKDSKSLDELIRKYRSSLAQYNSLQEQEISEIQKLLGTQRLAKYIVLKDQLGQKLKDYISQPTSQKQDGGTELGEPKVIKDE